MIKYYCDICETELQHTEVKVGGLDFNRGVLHLCDSCFKKFDSAKASLFSEYQASYSALDTSYLADLKSAILTNVDPEPIWDDPDDPDNPDDPTNPVDPEPVFEEVE